MMAVSDKPAGLLNTSTCGLALGNREEFLSGQLAESAEGSWAKDGEDRKGGNLGCLYQNRRFTNV